MPTCHLPDVLSCPLMVPVNMFISGTLAATGCSGSRGLILAALCPCARYVSTRRARPWSGHEATQQAGVKVEPQDAFIPTYTYFHSHVEINPTLTLVERSDAIALQLVVPVGPFGPVPVHAFLCVIAAAQQLPGYARRQPARAAFQQQQRRHVSRADR